MAPIYLPFKESSYWTASVDLQGDPPSAGRSNMDQRDYRFNSRRELGHPTEVAPDARVQTTTLWPLHSCSLVPHISMSSACLCPILGFYFQKLWSHLFSQLLDTGSFGLRHARNILYFQIDKPQDFYLSKEVLTRLNWKQAHKGLCIAPGSQG